MSKSRRLFQSYLSIELTAVSATKHKVHSNSTKRVCLESEKNKKQKNKTGKRNIYIIRWVTTMLHSILCFICVAVRTLWACAILVRGNIFKGETKRTCKYHMRSNVCSNSSNDVCKQFNIVGNRVADWKIHTHTHLHTQIRSNKCSRTHARTHPHIYIHAYRQKIRTTEIQVRKSFTHE